MSFTGVSHTTEGYPTDAYRRWCEEIYIKCGRYDSPEVAEAKKRIAINKAYAELTKRGDRVRRDVSDLGSWVCLPGNLARSR